MHFFAQYQMRYMYNTVHYKPNFDQINQQEIKRSDTETTKANQLMFKNPHIINQN